MDRSSPSDPGRAELPPEFDPRRGHRRARPGGGPGGARHTGRIVVRVLSAALSLFLVVYIGYLWNTVRGINDVQKLTITSIGGKSVDKATGRTVTRNDIDGQDQNLLIAGNDDRTNMTDAQVRQLKVGRDGGSLSTDSMLIIHVPADGSKATLISLPRDSYVKIPGYGMNKLNAAYALAYNDASGNANQRRAAGADILVQTIENLTGLNIDHFVQVSLLGFVTISDAIGGVQVNLCRAVNDTVAHNRSIGSDGGSGLVLSQGKHTVKGVTALEFVRQRHGLPNGDIDRTARQRYFLTAAFRKVASAGTLLNISSLRSLVTAVKNSIYVDQDMNMLELAKQMSNLSANNIVGKSIPFENFADTAVGSVEIVDPSKVQIFVKNLIATDPSAYADARAVDPSTVTVTVLNAGATNGAASAGVRVLSRAGFTASAGSASTANQQTTTIQYPAGMEAQAKTLARYVRGARVEQSDTETLTLVLGSDGRAPKARAAAAPSTSSTPAKPKAIDAGCIN